MSEVAKLTQSEPETITLSKEDAILLLGWRTQCHRLSQPYGDIRFRTNDTSSVGPYGALDHGEYKVVSDIEYACEDLESRLHQFAGGRFTKMGEQYHPHYEPAE